MTQDWGFDFGNTRVKCAPLGEDGVVGDVRALAPDAFDALPRGEVAFVASVAPEAARVALLDALAHRFRRIAIARTLPALHGLRIAYARRCNPGVSGPTSIGPLPCNSWAVVAAESCGRAP